MDYKIPDLIKFGLLLLVYTFYMAWWAGEIDTRANHNSNELDAHIAVDAIVSINVIKIMSQ